MLTYHNIDRKRCCLRCGCSRWLEALLLLLLLLWLPQGFATEQSAAEQSTGDQQRGQQASVFVQMTIYNGIALLKEGAAKQRSASSLYESLGEQLLPHVDITRTSRLVLGKYWKQAAEIQRNRFIEQFWKLLVRTYAISLSRYLDAAIDVRQPILKSKGRVHVPVTISIAGNVPSQVVYRIHTKYTQPLIYDVVVNGISLVKSYRASWSEVLKKEGIDQLIALIAEKN